LNGKVLEVNENTKHLDYAAKKLRHQDVIKFGKCPSEYVFKDNLDDHSKKKAEKTN